MSDDTSRRHDRSEWTGSARAVSTTVGYVLTLAITTVLITGLLIGGASLVDSQQNAVAIEELSVQGERVAAGIGDVDRMAAVSGEGTTQVRLRLPNRVAGSPYTISVREGDEPDVRYRYDLELTATEADVTVPVPVRTTTPLAANDSVAGGTVYVRFESDTDRLRLVDDPLSTSSTNETEVP